MYERQEPDAEFSQLPIGVQRQIIEKLIQAQRLAPAQFDEPPPLRFHAEGAFQTREGGVIRRLTVESRTMVGSIPTTHTSRFVVYSTGVVDLRR
jgi:phage terminase large subunit-like protein